MRRTVVFLVLLLAGCVAHRPMVSHDGVGTPKHHIEEMSGQAASRIAETYPAGTTVLHIVPDDRDPRIAAALERSLRLKGYAFAGASGQAGVTLAYEAGSLDGRIYYLRISSSDGRAFSLTQNSKE